MENLSSYIGLILAVLVVIVVVALQIVSFLSTKRKIRDFKSLFDNIDSLTLKTVIINSEVLNKKDRLNHLLNGLSHYNGPSTEDAQNSTEYIKVSLLQTVKTSNKRFSDILLRTNEYLCKNTGTSAEISVLEDICDTQIDNLEDEIQNSLNVPLYLGLAGTFIGIITGLWEINFEQLFGGSGGLGGLQHLLYGIMIAMCASLLGLGFTIYNSSVSYKKAVIQSNNGKERYIGFLRRELMPLLSKSMASSLDSLKSVLGHFVDKFGRNLDSYADSAELLNDNLEKQHLVLQEINQLSLTKTANKIAETFLQLKESSDSLSVFQTYQANLNETISNTSKMVNNIQALLQKFDEFAIGLSLLVANQNKSSELQREFKEAITTHFPTGSDARDVWRKEFDLFISEGKAVSMSLQEQLAASTKYIRDFVSNNSDFFDTFVHLKEVVVAMKQSSELQLQCYNDLKKELVELRKDQKDAQLETLKLHKSTLIAIETTSKAITNTNDQNQL